jgi:tetratricopeptide (TPR) repeat protein
LKTFKDDRIENRISLLYQLDVHSPIFARIASSEIEKGNLEEAKEILQTGLLHHPSYATAYFLNAIVLAKLGNQSEAKFNLNKGNEVFGNDQTFIEYSKIIEQSENIAGSEEDLNAPFLPYSLEDFNTDEFDTNFDDIKLEEDSEILDELETLAQELENAKIPPLNEGEVDFNNFENDDFQDNEIITETMASIYVEQGKYSKAISIYEKLIEQQPEKEQYYKIRIEEIRQSEDM